PGEKKPAGPEEIRAFEQALEPSDRAGGRRVGVCASEIAEAFHGRCEVGNTRCFGKTLEELVSFPPRLDRQDLDVRTEDRQRHPGKAGPRPDVDNSSTMRN